MDNPPPSDDNVVDAIPATQACVSRPQSGPPSLAPSPCRPKLPTAGRSGLASFSSQQPSIDASRRLAAAEETENGAGKREVSQRDDDGPYSAQNEALLSPYCVKRDGSGYIDDENRAKSPNFVPVRLETTDAAPPAGPELLPAPPPASSGPLAPPGRGAGSQRGTAASQRSGAPTSLSAPLAASPRPASLPPGCSQLAPARRDELHRASRHVTAADRGQHRDPALAIDYHVSYDELLALLEAGGGMRGDRPIPCRAPRPPLLVTHPVLLPLPLPGGQPG